MIAHSFQDFLFLLDFQQREHGSFDFLWAVALNYNIIDTCILEVATEVVVRSSEIEHEPRSNPHHVPKQTIAVAGDRLAIDNPRGLHGKFQPNSVYKPSFSLNKGGVGSRNRLRPLKGVLWRRLGPMRRCHSLAPNFVY